MTGASSRKIFELWPRDTPQDANLLNRLLYRTPVLKLLFEFIGLCISGLLALQLGTGIKGMLILVLIAPIASYMTAGYDQQIAVSLQRSLRRALSITILLFLIGLWPLGILALPTAILGGLAVFVARRILEVSKWLNITPVKIYIEARDQLNPYLVNSLIERLKERVYIVDTPQQGDYTFTLAANITAHSFPIAQAYPCLTGREVFPDDGPGFEAQVNATLKVQSPKYRLIKRIIDIALAGGAMVVLSPLLIVTWLAIKLESKGPAIFVQGREGYGGNTIKIRKFRSMKVAETHTLQSPPPTDTDMQLWTSKNDDRITRVGKYIRKFRIDELPQLWSIVLGEMSVVGPRPQRKFLNDMVPETYSVEKDLRLMMVPGLTGWAQVNGGYFGNSHDFSEKQSFEIEKLRYDVFYAKNATLLLDIKIILLTVKTVLGQKGH